VALGYSLNAPTNCFSRLLRSIVSLGFALSWDRFSSIVMASPSRAPAARISAAMVNAQIHAARWLACYNHWRAGKGEEATFQVSEANPV
jgi:hypothetical protein